MIEQAERRPAATRPRLMFGVILPEVVDAVIPVVSSKNVDLISVGPEWTKYVCNWQWLWDLPWRKYNWTTVVNSKLCEWTKTKS